MDDNEYEKIKNELDDLDFSIERDFDLKDTYQASIEKNQKRRDELRDLLKKHNRA